MPHYEFFCHTCKKTFSEILTMEGKDRLPALQTRTMPGGLVVAKNSHSPCHQIRLRLGEILVSLWA